MTKLPLDLVPGDVIRVHRNDYRVVALPWKIDDKKIVVHTNRLEDGRLETFTHRPDDPFEVVPSKEQT